MSHHKKYLIALAGSAHYLVYARAISGQGRHDVAGVFARGSKGHVKRLGKVNAYNATDFAVRGDLMTYVNGAAGKFYEWNLKTGNKRILSVPDSSYLVGPLGNGDLLELSGGTNPEVQRVSKDGAVTSLGTPFPDGQTFGTSYGSGAYVAFEFADDAPGGIVVGTLSHRRACTRFTPAREPLIPRVSAAPPRALTSRAPSRTPRCQCGSTHSTAR